MLNEEIELSDDAEELLIAANNDPQKQIFVQSSQHGKIIRVSGKAITKSTDRKDVEFAYASLLELEDNGLVQTSGNMDFYHLTKKGIELAEMYGTVEIL